MPQHKVTVSVNSKAKEKHGNVLRVLFFTCENLHGNGKQYILRKWSITQNFKGKTAFLTPKWNEEGLTKQIIDTLTWIGAPYGTNAKLYSYCFALPSF